MTKITNKQTKLLLIIGAIVLIALMIFAVIGNKKDTKIEEGQPAPFGANDVAPIPNAEQAEVIDPFEVETPEDIKVPEANEVIAEELRDVVAVPTVVTPAAPGASSKFRSFDIKAEGNKFTPSQIAANVGDTVHVNFTAVDKAYDITFFSYNMKQTAKAGETKVLEFQALKSGSFMYYCDLCGGPASEVRGVFVIVE